MRLHKYQSQGNAGTHTHTHTVQTNISDEQRHKFSQQNTSKYTIKAPLKDRHYD